MRRLFSRTVVAGAVAISLTLVPVAVPPAAAADPPAQAPCGSLGPPFCEYAQVLKQVLAPLEPVFAMGIPITDSLGAAVHSLQATLEQLIGDPEAVNFQDLAGQVGDVLDQLSGAPEPVATTLSLLGLTGLTSVLTDLQSALLARASTQATATAVTAAATASSEPPSAGLLGRAALASGPPAPAAPSGAPLDIPALGVPELGRGDAGGAGLAAAASTPEPDVAAPIAPDLDTTNDAAAVAAALGLSGVLLTAGLLAGRLRQRRQG
jgi:hypothetical protein